MMAGKYSFNLEPTLKTVHYDVDISHYCGILNGEAQNPSQSHDNTELGVHLQIGYEFLVHFVMSIIIESFCLLKTESIYILIAGLWDAEPRLSA